MAVPYSERNQTREVSDQRSPLLGVLNLASPLLTEKQVATFLNLSVKTIQSWRVTGRGRMIKQRMRPHLPHVPMHAPYP